MGLFDLASFLLSFFCAIKFYPFAARLLIANFSLPLGLANALGFLSIGFLSEIIFALIARQIVDYIPQSWRENRIEKALGVIPALGNSLIISAFLLTLIIILPVAGSVKSAIITSRIGGFLVTKTQGVEKQLDRVFGGAIEESLTFLTVKPESAETVDLRFTQRELSVDLAAEKEMFRLVNQERQKAGLHKLTLTQDALQELARSHAKDMFSRGYFSHYTPEGESPFARMDEAEIDYLVAGENLALAPSTSLAHQGLMNSPGHRANILSPDFTRIGLGVIDGGIYGKMFVQEFTN